jgi:opacity protein-like surface antigen
MGSLRVLIAVSLYFITANGFRSQSNGVYLGAEGGTGLATLRGDLYNDMSPLLSYSGGVFVQYNCRRVFSIRTGWYYDLKGSGIETQARVDSLRFVNVRAKSKFNYATVPLLFGFRFGENMSFFVNIGPYASFLLKQTTYVPSVEGAPVVITDDTRHFRNTEFGAALGLGISYPIANRLVLSAEIRNNLGLTEINDSYITDSKSARTNVVNLMLGVAYRLGGQKEALPDSK